MTSIHYLNADGPISPDWLTVARNVHGEHCHGGRTGFTLEYRTDDGEMLTLEEFEDIEALNSTIRRWHGPSDPQWVNCDITDTGGGLTPWRDDDA